MALPYDSPEGRDMAGGHRADVRRSVRAILEDCGAHGAVPGYEVNREPMLDVIRSTASDARDQAGACARPNCSLPQESWDTGWRTRKVPATRTRR